MHCHSPTSGSSSHQSAAKGIYPSVHEVSLTLLKDSTKQNLKKRKNDNFGKEPPKVVNAEKNNELHILKKPKGEMSVISTENSNGHFEHLVFAIPAPSRINSSQKLQISPIEGKQPTSLLSEAKEFQQKDNNEFLKVSMSPIALISSKQATSENGVNTKNEMQIEGLLSEGASNKIIKSMEMSNASNEKEEPSKLQKKTIANNVIAKLQVNSIQDGTKCGKLNSKRGKNKRELHSEGTSNIIFKSLEKSNASCRKENLLRLQKRVDEGIFIATPHVSKRIPNAPTLLTKKVQPALKDSTALTLKPSVIKMDSNIPSANLRSSKEVFHTDVGGKILKRDDGVPHVPSMSQQQFDSQTLNMSSRKGSLSIAKDINCCGSSILKSPKAISNKDLRNKNIDVINLLEPSPSIGDEQVISALLIIISKQFVKAFVNS